MFFGPISLILWILIGETFVKDLALGCNTIFPLYCAMMQS